MVEYAAQGVPCILGGDAVFHRLADGDAQAARMVRLFFKEFSARRGVRARAGHAFSTPRLHEHSPVWLLVVAYPHHIDLQFDAELIGSEGKSTSPLARPGFRCQSLDP